MSCYVIVNPYELNHHGVKGMKWGVRREQKLARKEKYYAAKEAKARTNIGKNYAAYQKYSYKNAKENQQAANKERSIIRKAQQKYGLEAQARNNKNSAAYLDSRASRAKTQRAKTKFESQAYNQRQFEKLHTKISKSTKSSMERSLRKNGEIFGTKLKTAKGKDTTYAKEYVKAIAKTAAVNMAISVATEMMRDDW